jgi:hypothetical protein
LKVGRQESQLSALIDTSSVAADSSDTAQVLPKATAVIAAATKINRACRRPISADDYTPHTALSGLLESAASPGEVVAVDIEWPQPLDEAKRD